MLLGLSLVHGTIDRSPGGIYHDGGMSYELECGSNAMQYMAVEWQVCCTACDAVLTPPWPLVHLQCHDFGASAMLAAHSLLL